MIKKRLLEIVPESKKYIAMNVLFQWLGMCCNIVMMYTIAYLLNSLLLQQTISFGHSALIMMLAVGIRIACIKATHTASYHASENVKKVLRGKLYEKLLKLGASYTEHVSTAEVVQLAGEGVEQLETYFGQYMPQFFYAFLAPVTLFFAVRPISVKVAVVLLVCVPLIPVSIVIVQKVAKRLLKNYWGQYAQLADHFLENLQGLTTLKIYQADEERHRQMNEDAEHFRKITMKVLTMQLNSIIVMDLVAYGGAALGILQAVHGYVQKDITFNGCLVIILLSADFFLPMRQLGSFFHVAMNGMTASDKIFAILDLPEESGNVSVQDAYGISLRNLHFGYTEEKEILHGIDMDIPEGSFISVVGESGCGKSTIAGILMCRNKGYTGSVTIGGTELSKASEKDVMERMTLISHNSYLFKGTVKENLLLGNPQATDEDLWEVLERVKLKAFVMASEEGLNMSVLEGGANLSGGQRQRLALTRGILHDSKVYIFDEATSNIDVESENDLMGLILSMAKDTQSKKTVLLISHRLANVIRSDRIYVLDHGNLVQAGTHEALIKTQGTYKTLWDEQHSLESLYKEAV